MNQINPAADIDCGNFLRANIKWLWIDKLGLSDLMVRI